MGCSDGAFTPFSSLKGFCPVRQHLTAVFLGIPSFYLGLTAPGGISCAPLPTSLVGAWPRSRGAVCQQSAGLLDLQQRSHGEHSFAQKTLQKSRLSSTKPIIILLKFHKVNLLTSLKDNRIVMAFGENKSNSNIAWTSCLFFPSAGLSRDCCNKSYVWANHPAWLDLGFLLVDEPRGECPRSLKLKIEKWIAEGSQISELVYSTAECFTKLLCNCT